jgi:ribonucleotide monophosphatase NagD (HAD superfamily)
LDLDSGAYIIGLERAAGVEATVVGKPADAFYDVAVKALGVERSQAVMVGDDVDADIIGARRAGLQAVLVRTGKFRQADLEGAAEQPNAVIDSVADLPGWLMQ